MSIADSFGTPLPKDGAVRLRAVSEFCRRFRLIPLLPALFALTAPAAAFPPAPYFTIFGYVRDQYGVLIPGGGASLVVLKDSKEVMRQPVASVGSSDFNYQIRMQMDMLRQATAVYSSKAMTAGSVYTIAVEVGGQRLYPIELSTPPTVGNSAERRRLNLTLGVDSDGDGLPDAWEEAQLYHAGIMPGPDGWDLSLIDRDGDFDGDGVSNFNEYIAGTYATDASSSLALEIKEKVGDFVKLEFYAMYGRSYTLEASSDLKTWSTVSFSLDAPVAATLTGTRTSLQSVTTGLTSIYAGASASATYHRLTSR
jgi:hypothetical protein